MSSGGGNKKYGVVYEFGITRDKCNVENKVVENTKKGTKYLMGMTEKKLINAYRKQDRDTLILYHRRDINWKPKWELGKKGGGKCSSENDKQLCWPRHVIMCLKTKSGVETTDLKHTVVDARYDLTNNKCGNWDGQTRKEEDEWKLYKQYFYPIWWEQLTWLLVNEK